MRSRIIKPQFFQNEKLADLSADHRLLFVGLWCMADREGRLEDRPRKIQAMLSPYLGLPISQMLDDLGDAGFIRRYEVGKIKIVEILRFKIHQRPHSRELPSVLPSYEGSQPRQTSIDSAGKPRSLVSCSCSCSCSNSVSEETDIAAIKNKIAALSRENDFSENEISLERDFAAARRGGSTHDLVDGEVADLDVDLKNLLLDDSEACIASGVEGRVTNRGDDVGVNLSEPEQPPKRKRGRPRKTRDVSTAADDAGMVAVDLPEQGQRIAPRQKRETWLSAYLDAWRDVLGGEPAAGKLAKALNKSYRAACDDGEVDALEAAWRAYLRHHVGPQARYVNPAKFAETWRQYSTSEPAWPTTTGATTPDRQSNAGHQHYLTAAEKTAVASREAMRLALQRERESGQDASDSEGGCK